MLNSNHPIQLAAYPDIFIYPDLEDASHYYAFSVPRLTRSDDKPDITLMLYQRGGVISGGQLNLTASLGLLEEEQQALLLELVTEGNPPPRISSPDWIQGSVSVSVEDVLTIAGQPSLVSHNQCALGISLTAQQAKATSKLWDSKENWLSVAYSVQFSGWHATAAAHQQIVQEPGCRTTRNFSVQSTAAEAITRSLVSKLSSNGGKRVDIKL